MRNKIIGHIKEFYPIIDETLVNNLLNYISVKNKGDNIKDSEKLEKAINISKLGVEEINLKSTAIVSILLFYCIDTDKINLQEINEVFGAETGKIVDGLIKVPVIQLEKLNIQAENFIKLLLTISTDVRTILIKLAEKLYSLRELKDEKEEEKINISTEISVLYAPIAHRLGLYAVKSEMEDLTMKFLHPDIYKDIAEKLEETKACRNKYIETFISPVDKNLKKAGIKCNIKGRPKSIFSIWKKMVKQKVEFDEVYDKFAIRVIIDSKLENEKDNCWQAYSIITNKYPPNPRRLRDWISSPKISGYESLHTTVIGLNEKWVEVQIRTQRMDEIAERGHAAHWKYKEKKEDAEKSDWLNKMRQALEKSENEFDNKQDEDKAKLYTDEIFIFTPDGDLKRLHHGYSILDFAFSIHTNIGESCTGAIVNGEIKNVKHQLKNGDEVKILTSKNQKPKYEWLEIVKSSRAKAKIKRSLKAIAYKNSNLGKDIVKQKLIQLKIEFNDININKLARYFNFKSALDFYEGVGSGKLDIHKIKKAFTNISDKLSEEKIYDEKELKTLDEDFTTKSKQDYLIIDDHLQTIDFQLAKCCNPIPGDTIFGFITVSKGTKIHKTTCPNAPDLLKRYPYRVVKAKWNTDKEPDKFIIKLHISGKDRVGIINVITEIIAKEFRLNLQAINIQPRKDNLFEGIVVTSVQNTKQLNSLIDRLKKIEDVYEVKRVMKHQGNRV